MSDFGIVHKSYWQRGSGKRLRSKRDALLVGLYLLTCPGSSELGIYYLPLPTLCHDLTMTVDEARAALAECSAQGLAHYDEDAAMAWLPNAAELRFGKAIKPNDKRRAWFSKEISSLGSHPFVAQFIARYGVGYGLTQTEQEGASQTQEAPSGIQNQSPKGQSTLLSSTSSSLVVVVSDPDPGSTPPVEIPPEDESGVVDIPEPRELTSDERYMAAYVRGIEAGKRGPYEPPGTLADQGMLNRALARFGRAGDGKALRGEALLGWIEDAASDFATDVVRKTREDPQQIEFFSGLACKGFVRWLNMQELGAEARRVG